MGTHGFQNSWVYVVVVVVVVVVGGGGGGGGGVGVGVGVGGRAWHDGLLLTLLLTTSKDLWLTLHPRINQ